jgi:hypothetical protein
MCDAERSLGDAKSSLCDAKRSLGDAGSSLGDAESSLGDAKSSLGEAKRVRGCGFLHQRSRPRWEPGVGEGLRNAHNKSQLPFARVG